MAEQLPDTYYRTPFKFNGKELDEETGLYYYGARYYDPKISIWLSVDPLAEAFPNWNPYNYTMQNPINLVDPTGMSSEEPGDPPKKGIWQRITDGLASIFNVNLGRDANKIASSKGQDEQTVEKLERNSGIIDVISENTQAAGEAINMANPYADELSMATLASRGQYDEMYSELEANKYYYAIGLLPFVNSKQVKLITKVGGKWLDAKELAKRLGTTVDDYHKNIKRVMKADFSKEMKKINSTNPDFSPNDLGNIMLKNAQTGKTIDTDVPFDKYIKK
jgi:RHS repeat-associated protein